ncbi:pyridoxamine 5'-phosphate oxidase [Corticibacter populi]|nr:pyridoxamine 5'-phosphate oxidase [Corticibacter populi]RZS35760.1 pyridoxamine 5'-phosphate oxidase [Corticibacter populi]
MSHDIDLAAMRVNYTRDVLLEDQVPADPQRLFDTWLEQAVASEMPEPNAMTLATVGSDLRPSTRIVLLKESDALGLVWYTNYQSRKGIELAGNPQAALQFHWVDLQRVVRVEGRVEKVSAEESDAYFAVRPLDSRLGAWASPQSQPIAGRAALEAAFEQVRQTLPDARNPARPAHWGGYRLIPETWEFWQGRASRLHDRIRYHRSTGAPDWQITRLAP